MTVDIRPGHAAGTVIAPPSKSVAHRLLICAGLAEGQSVVRNVAFSEDILATLDVLKAMGAKIETAGDTVTITGCDARRARYPGRISCRESGSTLRFFVPLLALSGTPFLLTGQGRLMERPQTVYETLFSEQGLVFRREGEVLRVQGPLSAGHYTLRGDISSQFFTGLLLALPLLKESSRITLLPPVESRSYIDLTLDALRQFGVTAQWTSETELYIPGKQRYQRQYTAVEGDWSNAAFFEALAAMGDDVAVEGVSDGSIQGDRVCRAYLQQMRDALVTLDVTDCPDLAPILMAAGAAMRGVVLTGTRRLAIKESDRGAAMAEELGKLGCQCKLEENRITVFLGIRTPILPWDGHNDHRIVMAGAVLLTRVGGTITGAEAVRKSFPDFFDRLRGLGIEVNEHAAGI
ncbi:MAG: 3-phosphoshikimate 1-carboxyvinyltransferase [Oscillospiraceae bacterium]|nr:3-phosphoshikimate 1-carboxyvinyltransferase [Oscillospiraceae bacterium]